MSTFKALRTEDEDENRVFYSFSQNNSFAPQAITVPSTAPYYVKALDSGYVWSNNGGGVTISYTFWNALPPGYSSSSPESNNFQPFTAAQKEATLKILGMISAVANVTFIEVANSSSAQLGFAQANLGSGVGAWAYYPGTSSKSGDVWTNNYYSATKTVTEGSYGFMLLAHETGHAMGLKHSFESPNVLTGAEDSSRYTVMSYSWPFYAESYMLYDIAALQAKYGTNMNYAIGDDNYALKSGHAYTIWDAGGNDTLDGSALAAGMTLDLNAGRFSSVGKTQNIAIAFNVTIENVKGGAGADIIYGNAAANLIYANGGDDRIYGSAGNDRVDGGAGIDTIVYSYVIADFLIQLIDGISVTLTNAILGMDTITNVEKFTFGSLTYNFSDLQNYTGGGGGGGGGNQGSTINGMSSGETLRGTSAGDVINGNGGYDWLYGGGGNDQINGGSSTDRLYGEAGDDILNGSGGADYLYGGDGADVLSGDAGNDYLYGEAGNDTLQGGDGTDRLYGGTGDDRLEGGLGTDYLYGGDGNDIVSGGAGNDYLYGDSGNDILVLGEGSDIAYGKAGSDTFTLTTLDAGADSVRDFTRTGSDADRLDIADILTGYDGSADISDFVQINVISSSRMDILVNQDGAGSDWVRAASVTGSNFSGVTLDDLIANAQLIVSKTTV